jgi:hypothetical protein
MRVSQNPMSQKVNNKKKKKVEVKGIIYLVKVQRNSRAELRFWPSS